MNAQTLRRIVIASWSRSLEFSGMTLGIGLEQRIVDLDNTLSMELIKIDIYLVHQFLIAFLFLPRQPG